MSSPASLPIQTQIQGRRRPLLERWWHLGLHAPPDARDTPPHILGSVKIGYEISFTRYFYKSKPMRTLEEIRADILALERETEGLLGEILEE